MYFEFLGLFGIGTCSFCGILVNIMKKIVEGDHSKVTNGLIIKLMCLRAQAHFHQETKSSGMSASTGSCLVVGGSASARDVE